jgi:hypothetical protein
LPRSLGGRGQGLDLGLLVKGDFDQLSIIPPETECRLLAVRSFPPHLDPADGPPPFDLDTTFDLRLPATMANPDKLSHAE